MTTETDPANSDEVETPPATEGVENETPSTNEDGATQDASEAGDEAGVEVSDLDFQSLEEEANAASKPKDLNRFQEIKVTVSADLGRASVPLQTLMNLGQGSILELDREIGSPVELVAQGVTLASGEVVVVNGCFAIRVTKVYEGQAG